ncbi:MAG: hypothetical protein ACTHN8_01830 [Angustibacter sp.]
MIERSVGSAGAMETPNDQVPTSSAQEGDAARSQDVKAALQRIIDDLGPRFADQPPALVRERLVAAIAEAGLDEQPAPWVDSAVAELSGGRGLVMDARFASGPERPGPSDPESQR